MREHKHLYYVEWMEDDRRIGYGWVIAESEEDAKYLANDEAIDVTRESQPENEDEWPEPVTAKLATSDDFDVLYARLQAQRESLRDDLDTLDITIINLEEVEV